jgi:hypothetical protein
MARQTLPVVLGAQPEEYRRLGIKPDQIEPWEDGYRTGGIRGTYEWWYFDAHLQDASKVVIVFYTKSLIYVDGPLAPYVAITLDRPGGSHLEQEVHAAADAFSASREACDVRIGRNTFAGDLRDYRIHVEVEDLVVDVTLRGTAPAWRPETGYLLFGSAAEHYFAWLPAVPQGEVEVTVARAGASEQFSGIGYHDHNWGNLTIARLINHWYWARGKIGDYTVIASRITAAQRYGSRSFTIFMLAQNGRVIAGDGSKVRFAASDIAVDEETRRPVADTLVYEFRDGARRFRLTFKRRKTILRMHLIATIPGIRRRLARLTGFDGKFLRFTGALALERYEGERLVATAHDEAIWELMYLGPVRRRVGAPAVTANTSE